jgi:quinolinate synthase
MSDSLIARIETLRRQRQAVILAHNYTVGEVQDVADFVGDSLELARRAATVEAEVIVFCGVYFMAETAKILNPKSMVLMPDTNAGCPMADMATGEAVRAKKAEHPGCAVVCYVNTTAEVKAESDICCTSGNAPAVVRSLPKDQPILFVPDRNLGSWTAEQTGRELILWDGYCPTHERILPQLVVEARQQHPEALVVAHPECPVAVRELADHLASTAGILAYCRNTDHDQFIIATEEGLLHRLRLENPGKTFHQANPRMMCPNMKRASLEKILWCLEDLRGQVEVDPQTAEGARRAIQRMFEAVP